MELETLIAIHIYACAIDYFRQDGLQTVSEVLEHQVQIHKISKRPYKQKYNLSFPIRFKIQIDDLETNDLLNESIFAKNDSTIKEWVKWIGGTETMAKIGIVWVDTIFNGWMLAPYLIAALIGITYNAETVSRLASRPN